MFQTTPLIDGWALHQLSTHGRLDAATVERLSHPQFGDWTDVQPQPVALALHAAGELPDPTDFRNAADVAWVHQSDWVYRIFFPTPERAEETVLHCAGLDTAVDIWLNGRLIHTHEDCYMPADIVIGQNLTGRTDHCLLFHFFAPNPFAERELAPRLEAASRELGVAPHRVFRKPHCDFNGFLGPSLPPIGIYGPVSLQIPDGVTCGTLATHSWVSEDLNRARLRLGLEGASLESGPLTIHTVLKDPEGTTVVDSVEKTEGRDWRWAAEHWVDAPALWHPRRYGKQHRYRLTIELSQGGRVRQCIERRIAFRHLRQVGPFEFQINRRPIRLWGLNLAPVRPARLLERERLLHLLDLAENADCAVLRIWGPGQPYDNDTILEEADRRGLLLWMEFPHEFFPVPDDAAYLAQCAIHARSFVRRYRHHPSILLWCGGNEAYLTMDTAQAPDSARLSRCGRELFERIYPQICGEEDPERYYHPQSPFGGDYANDPRAGDTHYYQDLCVQPGMNYPSMITEHFRCTDPLPQSVRHWLGDDAWPSGFRSRLLGPDGEGLIPDTWKPIVREGKLQTYQMSPLGETYERGDTLEELCDRFAGAAISYIRRSVERIRRGRPHSEAIGKRRCHGHIWWKFNDTFPMLRNSLVDAVGEPNAGYYALRRAYAPVLLSFELDPDDRLVLWLVNDSGRDLRGEIVIEQRSEFGEKVLRRDSVPCRVLDDEAQPVYDCSRWGSFFRNLVLAARLLDADGNELAVTSFIPAPEVGCRLEDPGLAAEWDGDAVVLRSERFARRVTLRGIGRDGNELGWYFQDNYLDLLPGRELRVPLLNRHPPAKISVIALGMDAPLVIGA